MGAASTDNILQKIDESIASTEIKPMTEEDERNKMMWEQGQPDIMGSASTDNILRKLDNVIGKPNQGKWLTYYINSNVLCLIDRYN